MANVETPPPSIEIQDPLPESNWLWRRIYIFVITTIVAIAIWRQTQTMIDLAHDQPELIVGAFLQVIRWEIIIGWCAMTYYLIAPSAEQLGKWLATISAWKSGVSTAQVQTATAADGSAAHAQTLTGPGVTAPMTPPSSEVGNSGSGLPGNPVPYAGPPPEDVPEPPKDIPENAPWPR